MKRILFFLTLLLIVVSCKNSKSKAVNYNIEIPKTVVNKIIFDRLDVANKQMDSLNHNVKSFTKNPTVVQLKKAQNSYIALANTYAKLYVFNIGFVKDKFFNRRINFWPVYNIAIEKSIKEKELTPTEFSDFGSASKNMPALAYLLFKYDDNQKIVDEYLEQPARKKYLDLSVNELSSLFVFLDDIWFGTANYATSFKNSTEKGLEGAFNLLYNGINNVVDNCKVTKIGKPAGLEKSSHTNPEIVESFYSGNSLELIKSNLESVEELFFSGNIVNISSYITKATKSDVIANKLKTQIKTCFTILNSIQNPLKTAVKTEKEKVKKLHKAFSDLSITVNTDIRSALSIIITGTDNDGD